MNMNNLRYPGQWYVLTCAICLLLVPAASARFRVTDLGTIGTGTNPSSVAYGINNTGTVVGFSNSPLHAFRDPGVMLDLGTLGGATSYGFGVNDHGQVVGSADTLTSSHAFLYAGTTMSDLGTLGGAKSTATAINAGGWIAGYSDTSTALAINNHGPIVGEAAVPSGCPNHGFIAYCQNRMVDINPMTDASGAGWTIMSATAINDAGQVAAWGQNSNGEYHALLLTFLGSLSC
jgi:probable HAF family extracellular repeat protein